MQSLSDCEEVLVIFIFLKPRKLKDSIRRSMGDDDSEDDESYSMISSIESMKRIAGSGSKFNA